jgi:translation initiation factor IF-2
MARGGGGSERGGGVLGRAWLGARRRRPRPGFRVAGGRRPGAGGGGGRPGGAGAAGSDGAGGQGAATREGREDRKKEKKKGD